MLGACAEPDREAGHRPPRERSMLNLTYLDCVSIEDQDAGLTEPSGLVLGHGGDGLWTVSDDTEKVFHLTLKGKLDPERSFEVPYNGLEGITLEPSGRFLFTVQEETNSVIRIEVAERRVVAASRLAEMKGYDAIASFFAGSQENKGLEGIAWSEHSRTLFALKEGEPGLLIEIEPDLATIRGHAVLGAGNGFTDPGTEDHKVDYSGICYDTSRSAFWIVSDKARRVYLYDPKADAVIHCAPLGYGEKGEYKEVKKAEGVAYDPDTSRLYVVSDEEVRLYIFAVRR